MPTRPSNFQLNVAEGVSFQVAMGFMSPLGVLPLFVAGFTDAKWALGLLGAILMVGALPQALGVSCAARARDFLAHARLQMLAPRLVLVAVALAPWLPGPLALVGFFVLLAVFQLAMGFATPAWLEFVHLALPLDRHGAFFGRRTAWGAACTLLSLGGSSVIIAMVPAPWSFRLCFALAALAWLVTYPCLLATRIEAGRLAEGQRARRGFGRAARRLWHEHPEFRRYLAGRCLTSAGGMATAFYAVHGVARYHMPVAAAALLPVAMTLLPALAGDSWGRFVDRHGACTAVVPFALAAAAAHGVMLGVPSAGAYVAALTVVGTASVVADIAQGQFLLGLGAEACGAGTSLLGIAMLPITAGAPLLAGVLADTHGMALVLGLAGLAWLTGGLALGLPVILRPVTPGLRTAHRGGMEGMNEEQEMAPLVSVLVATYNQPEYLAELLESLSRQTFQDFEVVIVNDAGCPVDHVLRLYPDLALRVVERSVNRGQTACLNAGLELLRTPYVMLCDTDDMLAPGHLGAMVAAIADADLVFADAEVYGFERREGLRIPTHRRLLAHRFERAVLDRYLTFTPSGMLYRRELHAVLGPFDPALAWCYWDWDWVLRVARAHRIRRVPVASVFYAFGNQNMSSDHEAMRPTLDYFMAKHRLADLFTTNFGLMTEDPRLEAVRAPSRRVWDGQPVISRLVAPRAESGVMTSVAPRL